VGVKITTFDVNAQVWCSQRHGWLNSYEIFCVCRQCHLPTTFVVEDTEINMARDFYKDRNNGLVKFTAGLNHFFASLDS
jgi:hypothetical protein